MQGGRINTSLMDYNTLFGVCSLSPASLPNFSVDSTLTQLTKLSPEYETPS